MERTNRPDRLVGVRKVSHYALLTLVASTGCAEFDQSLLTVLASLGPIPIPAFIPQFDRAVLERVATSSRRRRVGQPGAS